MPFFCFSREVRFSSVHVSAYFPILKEKALQVRIPLKNSENGKRASFSASAGMTLEAALALPLFLFAGLVLLFPLRILDTERQMQAIVTSVGEDISRMAYLTVAGEEMKDRLGMGTFPDSDMDREDGIAPEQWAEGMGKAAAWAYAEAAVRRKAERLPADWLSLAGSRLLEDGETIDLVVSYRIRLPFSVFGLGSVKRTSGCYLRAWIGTDGKGDAAEESGGEDDPIVYVGKESSRYHKSAFCHYLSNHLTAVSAGDVSRYRNSGGSRYTACARCGGQKTGTVYIMQAGRHYHSSRTCSAIQAYVSAVRRSSVEHLGACSYCGGE